MARFAETGQDFYVMLAERTGHVLPKRFFPTLEAAAIFGNQLRAHLEREAPRRARQSEETREEVSVATCAIQAGNRRTSAPININSSCSS